MKWRKTDCTDAKLEDIVRDKGSVILINAADVSQNVTEASFLPFSYIATNILQIGIEEIKAQF